MTACWLISSASLATPGSSETAKAISTEILEGRRLLQKSQFFGSGAKGALEELFSVSEDCCAPNWDGYGAEPMSHESFVQAYRFLEALPLEMQPSSVVAEPDGHIALEWYKSPQRILSVSITPNGDLHYAAINGRSKTHGTEDFLGDVPEVIIGLINRVKQAQILSAT
jgi:hypothetical protein